MGTFLSGVATVFYRLLDHSIEISVLICLIFFVKWVAAKKLPSWWHYSLWLILLVRMLIPVEFENRLNVFNFIPDIGEHQVFEIIAESSFENETSAAQFTSTPSPDKPDWRYVIKNSVPVLWLAGAVVFGFFVLIKSISFWRSVRCIPCIADKEVLHLLARCKKRMKIQAKLDVIVTDKVRSPALFGYFHPRLLLPKGIFEKLGDTDLAYAFMHELGHLKRHDIGVSWIMAVLQTVYWFNPLVWVAFYHVRIDQESACDESVLSRIKHHQSTDYAKAIVGFLEKFYQNCQLPSLAGVLENKTQMKRRIANIVHYRKYSQKLTMAAVTLFFSTGFVLYLFTGVAKVEQEHSMTAEVESSLPADAGSIADGEEIVGAEVIASRTESESVPVNPTPGDISRSMEENENSREVPRTDLIVSSNDGASSQIRGGAADAAMHAARSQDAEESNHVTSNAVSPNAADNPVDADRVDEKSPVFSVDPGHRTANTGTPTAMENEPEPETGVKNKQQPEEKRTSSYIASVVAGDTGAASPATPAMKAGERDAAGKKAVETIDSASVTENGANNDSGRHIASQTRADGILPAVSSHGRAENQPKTSVSAAEREMTAGVAAETLQGKEVEYAILKTDPVNEAGDTSFLVSDVDMLPKLIRSSSPQYPYRAKRNKITGYIKLRFVVTKEGDAVDMTVVESSPKGVFDKSALEALESYRFKPGMKDGKAVDVQVSLPIKYDLT